ncbi:MULTISPECIES: hypothetical protein [Roseobacteraceae]|uniref:hypothetical protein n=1 Tax=Roseobacteraceae TaxID=2854170 RepID=UPI0012FDD58C|nr:MULTISPECIES: hypothetical protein [Roseobacteraceae]
MSVSLPALFTKNDNATFDSGTLIPSGTNRRIGTTSTLREHWRFTPVRWFNPHEN